MRVYGGCVFEMVPVIYLFFILFFVSVMVASVTFCLTTFTD